MENQPSGLPHNSTNFTPMPARSSKALLIPILLTFVVTACIFSFIGYLFGKKVSNISSNTAEITATPTIQAESLSVIPTTLPSVLPTDAVNSGWNNYSVPSINLSFQYPSHLIVSMMGLNSTALAADQQYIVGYDGSDITYLDIFLYNSNKNPSDWWSSEGQTKFEKLAEEMGEIASPNATVKLTYNVQPTTFAGKEALDVVVSSNLISPHTPSQRYLTIFQENGNIVMLSYHDQGTEESSINLSKEILSTFKLIK